MKDSGQYLTNFSKKIPPKNMHPYKTHSKINKLEEKYGPALLAEKLNKSLILFISKNQLLTSEKKRIESLLIGNF